jgi:hypothetical protein
MAGKQAQVQFVNLLVIGGLRSQGWKSHLL